MEKDMPCKPNSGKAGVAILILGNVNCRIKIIKDKEGHYIIKKGYILNEDVTILICMHITIDLQDT